MSATLTQKKSAAKKSKVTKKVAVEATEKQPKQPWVRFAPNGGKNKVIVFGAEAVRKFKLEQGIKVKVTFDPENGLVRIMPSSGGDHQLSVHGQISALKISLTTFLAGILQGGAGENLKPFKVTDASKKGKSIVVPIPPSKLLPSVRKQLGKPVETTS